MANHKSSEKRARASLKKRDANRHYLSAVRTAVKNFKAAVTAGAVKEGETLADLFTSAQSMLAKAAAKGMLHRNNAARRIGRLADMMKVKATTAAPVKATTAKAKTATKAAKTATKAAKTATKSSKTPAKKVTKSKK